MENGRFPEQREHDVSNMAMLEAPSDRRPTSPQPMDLTYDLTAYHQDAPGLPGMIADGDDAHYPPERQQELFKHLTHVMHGVAGLQPDMDHDGFRYLPVDLSFGPNNGTTVPSSSLHPAPTQNLPLTSYASSTGSIGGDNSFTDHDSAMTDPISWANNEECSQYHYASEAQSPGSPGVWSTSLAPEFVAGAFSPAPDTPPVRHRLSVCPQDVQRSPDSNSDASITPTAARPEGVELKPTVSNNNYPQSQHAPPVPYGEQGLSLFMPGEWHSYAYNPDPQSTTANAPVPSILISPAKDNDDSEEDGYGEDDDDPSQQLPATSHQFSFDEGNNSVSRSLPSPPPAWPAAANNNGSSFNARSSPAPGPRPSRNPTRQASGHRHHNSTSSTGSSSSSRLIPRARDRATYPCVFKDFGCNCVFLAKNEWKRHASTIHLQLVHYECDLGDCASDNPQQQCSFAAAGGPANIDPSYAAIPPKKYNRPDLFAQHIRRMHSPWRSSDHVSTDELNAFVRDVVKPAQERCRRQRTPPARTRCPICAEVFHGADCWDRRMEHVGRHIENGEQTPFREDEFLKEWAVREGIVKPDPSGRGLVLADTPGRKRKRS